MESIDDPYVIEFGDLWYRERKPSKLGGDLRHVCGASDEIAIAHDGEILLKAGSADMVDHWYEANKEKFDKVAEAMAAMGHEGAEVVIVRFGVSPETVAELNACVSISGRVSQLEANLARIVAAHPELCSRPTYPA